jgi:hypothetical protein
LSIPLNRGLLDREVAGQFGLVIARTDKQQWQCTAGSAMRTATLRDR